MEEFFENFIIWQKITPPYDYLDHRTSSGGIVPSFGLLHYSANWSVHSATAQAGLSILPVDLSSLQPSYMCTASAISWKLEKKEFFTWQINFIDNFGGYFPSKAMSQYNNI